MSQRITITRDREFMAECVALGPCLHHCFPPAFSRGDSFRAGDMTTVAPRARTSAW